MPSPFPGMDPYLEQTAFWSSFHSRILVAIADEIESHLSSQYYVEVETRTYQSDEDESLLIGIPDAVVFASQAEAPTPKSLYTEETSTIVQYRPERVTVPVPQVVNERYLEVRELSTDAVITVIELLSPKNKRSGEGRAAYEKKRRAVLSSLTHLVELDLLRGGKQMAIAGNHSATPYRFLISRSEQRPIAALYGFRLQEAMPSFPLPLKPEDPELLVSLQEVFNGVYDRARYRTRIDYRQAPPPPALSESDQQWVEALLAPLRSL
jgi:hypothetical protein